MLAEFPYVLLIAGAVLVGLYLANYFLDRGIVHWMSRKIGHLVAGTAYLMAVFLFSSPFWPLILSGGFTLLLMGARIAAPKTFRGVGGSARGHAFAECWLPGMATVSLGVGWLWLGNPWLAVVPILFVCWGDAVTGIVRSRLYSREVKGNWGSAAMLGVCLLVAYLFQPYWIALGGAVVATAVERFTPLSRGAWDDNCTITVSAMAVMVPLYYFIGG